MKVRITVIAFSMAVLMMTGSEVFSQDLKAAIKLTRSEQFTAAETAFKNLIQQSPQDGDIYYYYGQNFLQEYFSDTVTYDLKEKSDAARKIFQQGVVKDSANPLNYIGLAEVDMLMKDLPAAQGKMDKVMTLLPSKANKKLVMAPEKHAMALIQAANAYVRAGVSDTAKIFGYLRTAEKLDKKNFDLYIVRGDAYIFMLNDGSKAIASYNLAQSYNPESSLAKLRIGQLWLRARNYKDALTYYQEVIKMDPNFAPAYRELGFLLSKAGRNEEAKQNFQKFLALSAGNVTARVQYVNTLFEIQDYKTAVEELNTVYRSDSSNNDLNRALAYAYYETGTYDKGLYYIQKYFKNADPEKIRSTDYSYYGRLLAKNKFDSLAPEQLMKAYELDTSKPELITEAAMSWVKIKKYPQAAELFNKKIALNKANAMDYYNLGKIYYNMQDFINADTNLAIFNQMQPDYIPGFVWRGRTKSNLDPESDLGLAKPVYEAILEKTTSDTLKYQKERMEAMYYLAFYYFKQFTLSKQKDREAGQKSIEYCNRIIAIDPNDDKALKAKQIIDTLKKFIN